MSVGLAVWDIVRLSWTRIGHARHSRVQEKTANPERCGLHHEYRPDVCADFEPGGTLCIDTRESRGIGPPHPPLREGADPDD